MVVISVRTGTAGAAGPVGAVGAAPIASVEPKPAARKASTGVMTRFMAVMLQDEYYKKKAAIPFEIAALIACIGGTGTSRHRSRGGHSQCTARNEAEATAPVAATEALAPTPSIAGATAPEKLMFPELLMAELL